MIHVLEKLLPGGEAAARGIPVQQRLTPCTQVFREGVPEEVMGKERVEGGEGVPQIFRAGRPLQEGGAACWDHIASPGVSSSHWGRQERDGQGGARPGDQRRQSLFPGLVGQADF